MSRKLDYTEAAMSCDSLYTLRDGRNYMRFMYWMMASLVVFGVASVLIRREILRPGVIAWTLVFSAVVLMSAAVCAYMQFLRNADELLRKVHLEALAFAFGVGAVMMMGYRLAERLGAPSLDVNDPLLVMMLTWLAGQWVGARRYTTAEEQQ